MPTQSRGHGTQAHSKESAMRGVRRGFSRLFESLSDPDPTVQIIGYVVLGIIAACAIGIMVLLSVRPKDKGETPTDRP